LGGGGGGFLGHESLEERNQEMEGELKGKISALKSLSIDIGMEVREQNRLANSFISLYRYDTYQCCGSRIRSRFFRDPRSRIPDPKPVSLRA
jgi:hypothetical protein